MKISKFDETILLEFGQNDFERIIHGGINVNNLLNEAIRNQVIPTGFDQRVKSDRFCITAGLWYYIIPEPDCMEYCSIRPGTHKVTRVDGPVFYIDNDNELNKRHVLDCYAFTPVPIADAIESWKTKTWDQILESMTLWNDRVRIRVPMPVDYVKNEVQIVKNSTSVTPLSVSQSFLRMKFVPAPYSNCGAKRVVDTREYDCVRGTFEPDQDIYNFMRVNGCGEYFFRWYSHNWRSGSDCSLNWSVFYLPDEKNDPNVWFPTDTADWGIYQYQRISDDGQYAWYIYNDCTESYLWKDGSTNVGTKRFYQHIGLLTDSPGFFESEDTAKRFLIAWINQNKKPYSDWKLHRYETTVVLNDGHQTGITTNALDLYEVAENVLNRYPTSRIIHVESVSTH